MVSNLAGCEGVDERGQKSRDQSGLWAYIYNNNDGDDKARGLPSR